MSATPLQLWVKNDFIWHVLFVSLCVLSRSVVSNSATPWTVACQAPLSMGFPRQEYWSGLPFPPPGHLPHPGTKPASPVAPALAGGFFITAPPGKPLCLCMSFILVERKMWKDSGLPLNLVEHPWHRALIAATLYFSFAGSLVSLRMKFKIFVAFFYSFSFWDLLLPSREKLSFKMCDFIIHNQE